MIPSFTSASVEVAKTKGTRHYSNMEERIVEAIRNFNNTDRHMEKLTITFLSAMHEETEHSAISTGEDVPSYLKSSILSMTLKGAKNTGVGVPHPSEKSIIAKTFESTISTGECVPVHRKSSIVTITLEGAIKTERSMPNCRSSSVIAKTF